MRIKQDKISELSQRINEKARELQGVQEAVDSAIRDVRELGERKQKLNKEIFELDSAIKDKQSLFDSLLQKERDFLSSIQKEIEKEKNSLGEIKYKIQQEEGVLQEITVPVQECRNFLRKAKEARVLFLDQTKELADAEKKFREVSFKRDATIEEMDKRQKEMDFYKNYLTDFYGKVSVYTKSAQDVLEFINKALEEKIEFTVELPDEPITLENFNK